MSVPDPASQLYRTRRHIHCILPDGRNRSNFSLGWFTANASHLNSNQMTNWLIKKKEGPSLEAEFFGKSITSPNFNGPQLFVTVFTKFRHFS